MKEEAAPHQDLVAKAAAFDVVAGVTFAACPAVEGTARQELRRLFRYNSKEILLLQLFSVCWRKWCRHHHPEVSLLSAACVAGAFLLWDYTCAWSHFLLLSPPNLTAKMKTCCVHGYHISWP